MKATLLDFGVKKLSDWIAKWLLFRISFNVKTLQFDQILALAFVSVELFWYQYYWYKSGDDVAQWIMELFCQDDMTLNSEIMSGWNWFGLV